MPAPTITGFEHRLVVGLADLAVSNNQNVTLTTYSLGSCVGVAVYDPLVRVGGLLHAMLPDSKIDASKAIAKPAMFVDTGFALLVRGVLQMKADLKRLRIHVAGGAQIMDNGGYFNIGLRNYETFRRILAENSLRAEAEEVGGLVSRSMFLSLSTGEVRLKISGQPKEVVLCKS